MNERVAITLCRRIKNIKTILIMIKMYLILSHLTSFKIDVHVITTFFMCNTFYDIFQTHFNIVFK